ncbi:RND family transporter [Kangiella sp. TOML190]|uniref:efflux RND transporter permease subunit n=1 Tax=Kangiella sp. TOML190 TaxID=2931351 RepID=UPI002041AAB4|nr:MMPL family transporter [Kangiella sp. TOML190]
MKNHLFQFSVNRPKWVYALLALLSFACAAFIVNIKIDTDPENMLAADQVERVFHNQIKQRFQLHDAIVLGAVSEHQAGIYNPKSLSNLIEITDWLTQLQGVLVADLVSIANVDNITQQNGALRFEWMMQSAPTNLEQSDKIKQQLERLPLFKNTLVSADHQAAAVYIPIKNKDQSYQISQQITDFIATLDSDDQYHITGLPVAEDTFGFEMFVQMGISAPLAALMIFVLMWLFFRNLKFVAAPMIVAMATVIIVMGVMIGMGFTVHIMSSMIPIFLMPIAVVDSVHIMSEFADHYRKHNDKQAVIKKVIDNLYKPMLFTSLTSAVGFASLMLTPIPPVQVFGAFVAFGILLAFMLTIIFIPAYLTSLKAESLASLKTTETRAKRLERWLPKLGVASFKYSKGIIAGFVVLIILAIIGIQKIQINDNPTRWFKADHKIRIADKVLNQHFAGTYDAYLVLEKDSYAIAQRYSKLIKSLELNDSINTDLALGSQINEAIVALEDKLFAAQNPVLEKSLQELELLKRELAYFQSPQALKLLEQIQNELAANRLVGKSMSLVEAVKTVNRELRSGLDQDYQIPASQPAVAQTLLQYQSSHRPNDLWHLVTQDYSSAVIWLQMTSGDNQKMSQIISKLDNYFVNAPLPEGVSANWAGKTFLNKIWQDEMVAGMLTSLLSAFVVVFIMMVLLFRNVWLGLLAMLPLTITITSIYGLIGWLGKDYDMPIAVLSALTLGLSVDFAIHFVQRSRDIYRQTGNLQKTFEQMYKEPASAISRNAIVIAVGFTPLLVAPLMPYVTVGFFLATIMAVSALVTLVLLPIALKQARKQL